MRRLYEKKDNLNRKNPNLTEEQKQEIIEVLTRHPSYENKIDWIQTFIKIVVIFCIKKYLHAPKKIKIKIPN